jgi:hypothetical protein
VSRRALDILMVIALAVPCFAGDREFKSVVSTVESQYGVHKMHIPLLGFATLCLKVAGTPGASGLKIAVFQHMPRPRGSSDAEFEQNVGKSLGQGWRPFVRVRSREENKFTLIYTNATEKDVKMMIVALNPDDATVVQVNLKSSDLKRWIEDPEGNARGEGKDQQDKDQDDKDE